jgi:DNA-binding MarR family transcriptional regulator
MVNMKDRTQKFMSLSRILFSLCLKKEMIQRQCSNLGRTECELLNFLDNQEEPVCMNDLAVEMKVSHSRITRIIDTLVKKNLVKRFPSKRDRRSWLARITENGKNASKRTLEDFIEVQERLIAKLPADKIEEIYENVDHYLSVFLEVLKEEK